MSREIRRALLTGVFWGFLLGVFWTLAICLTYGNAFPGSW